uniref:ARAD1A03586p n=1 Tax=Blastobotrys adeninivorans TaxID=409370 RepID=A0A060SWW9_BLAAD
MLDPYSYVAPSRVRVLVCPFGSIKQNAFFQSVERLHRAREVRLLDVTPDPRQDRSMFSPKGYPNGKVIYDFSTSVIDEQLHLLYDLEPWRQTMVVLGLTIYRQDMEIDFEKSLRELKSRNPNALLHRLVILGVPSQEVRDSLASAHKGLLPVLSSKVTVSSIESAMADLTTEFLAELAVFTISKQLGSFKSPGVKQLDSPASASRPGDKPYNVVMPRASSYLKHSASESSVSVGRSASISKTGSISIGMNDKTKSKQKGRSAKFLGNMYLLAGRVPDALKSFCEAATILKATYDHLWHGSALEAIGICLVILAFLEVPTPIPQVALTEIGGNHYGKDHSSRGHQSSHSVSLVPSNGSAKAYDSTSSLPSTNSPGPTQGGRASTFDAPSTMTRSTSNLSISSAATGTGAIVMTEFLPDLTNAVLRYFDRSHTSSDDSVPQIVYCETILRFVKFLVVSRLGGGWNPAVLSAVVRDTTLDKNITSDSPSCSIIGRWCNTVYTTEVGNLPVLAQCNIYSGLASVYSAVGMLRKRSFVLRELLLNIIPKIVQSRQQREAPTNAENPSSAQMGKRKFSPFSHNRKVSTPHHNSNRFLSLLEGVEEKGILDLLDTVVTVYGAGDVTARGSGWADLKLSFLKVCVSVCQSMPDLEGVIYYSGLILATSADVLSKDEQVHYFEAIQHALDASRKLGRGDIAAQYWDLFILRDIRLVSPSSIVPVEKSTGPRTAEASPFLYNPYTKRPQSAPADRRHSDASSRKILVQKEAVEFVVKLQNPFEFEVQVGELVLLTEGARLDASINNVYIPPHSIFEVGVQATPKSVGNVKVTGCKIQVVGCAPGEYHLLRRSELRPEEKIKMVGIESGIQAKDIQTSALATRHLEFTVVPNQPIVALKSLSLTQGWIMLLEGETHTFTLTLSNISSVPVNLVEFHFTDSTADPLQQAIQSKELPLSEVYECEYFLYKRHPLKWLNSTQSRIDPHQTGQFDIQISGKRGMTSATLNIDYGHKLGVREGLTPDSLDADDVRLKSWTRTISVPVNVTVAPSVELGSCDIIPLRYREPLESAIELMANDGFESSGHEIAQLAHSIERLKSFPDSQCVLLLADVRNAYTSPLEATVWSLVSEDSEEKLAEVTETVYPNRTKRFLIPIRWEPLTAEQVEQNIPLMSRKQFVVDSSEQGEHGRMMKEAFWNRSKLLKLIGGQWTANTGVNHQRSGSIEFRGLRLTPRMVNVLRREEIEITMEMECDSQGIVTRHKDTSYRVKMDHESGVMKVSIRNCGTEPVAGMLRLIPGERYSDTSAPDHHDDNIGRKILYNGVLQRPIKLIEPGQTVDLCMGVVYICRGEYVWTSVFEVSTPGPHLLDQHIQRQPMYVRAV